MITIKTPEEIKILREGGKILASVLLAAAEKAKAGVATIELDTLAEKMIRQAGGEPAFKGYKTRDDKVAYPASLCVSINDEVVHGIPSSKRILKDGDIVSLDAGMKYKNLYTDTATTVGVGKISVEAQGLIDITKKSLDAAIAVVKEGAYIGDIGFAIESFVRKNSDFDIVRDLVGHGVGYKPHEEPEIPNYGDKKTRERLKAGMILAIEPMITAGDYKLILMPDNWTFSTKDGSLSAHFEHTLVVTKNGAEVLTV